MDIRELDRRALAATGAVIARIGARDWTRPTPCSEWTLRDIVEHLVDSNWRFAGFARGESAPESPAPGTDPARAFAESADALCAATAPDESLTREFDLGRIGVLPGRNALAIHFGDTLVHGWDLARALGEEHELDTDLAEAALRITSRFPDTPPVRGQGGAFGPALPPPAGATPTQRLVAWLGRDFTWQAPVTT